MEKAKKLSIEDLKKQQTSQNVVAGIDAIMGGVSEEYCHNGNGKQMEILQYMLKNAKFRAGIKTDTITLRDVLKKAKLQMLTEWRLKYCLHF